MQNRNRTGVLLFREGKILLVKHEQNGFVWWVPPGGGIEGSEDLFSAGKREVWEETNLDIKPGRVVYLRQYIANENHVEVFILGEITGGSESMKNLEGLGGDEECITELRYFSKDELRDKTVFPEIIKDEMWEDYKKGFPGIKFLGVQNSVVS